MGKLTLTNVGATPSKPVSNNQSLYFDANDGHLKKIDSTGTITDLELGGSGATSISTLTDVDVSGATAGSVLIYTGTTWSAGTPQLEDINDIGHVS